MIKKLQQSFNGDDLNAATSGIIYFRLEENCVIKAISILTDANTTGDLTFNCNLAGVDLFSGAGRPKILSGQNLAEKTALNINGNKFDVFILNLISINAGIAKAPITLILEVDDGVSVGGGGGGDGFEQVTFTNLVNAAQELYGAVKKTAGTNAWDAGCYSVESIADVGKFKVVVVDSTGSDFGFMVGASIADPDANFTSILRAILVSNGGNIYESGSSIISVPVLPKSELVFELYRDGSNNRRIKYAVDSFEMRDTTFPEGPAHLDVSFYGVNSRIIKAFIQI